MSQKNFFDATYFSPYAASVFIKFIRRHGEISFKMYSDGETIEYEATNFKIFLSSSILTKGKFGKIQGSKKIILNFSLSEEDFKQLIELLKGSYKKINLPPKSPTLGDLLK